MRAKILFFLFAYYLIIPISIGNTEGLQINGYDWQKWDRGEQISFVIGWIKSGNHALDNFPVYLDKYDESLEFINSTTAVFKDKGILLYGVTVGQVVDTINIIYSDPRVKLMDISEIMPLLSGRLIQGWTKGELDEVIAINVKLKQCEKEEKSKGQFIEECSSSRKYKNSYLQKIKKGN